MSAQLCLITPTASLVTFCVVIFRSCAAVAPCACDVQGKQVSRSSLLQNLVRNTNINLAGIGITLIGLQASGRPC
jgi:hypothetical protein